MLQSIHTPVKKIRTIIIDEEVLVRQLIYKILREDPLIEVVGTYSNVSNIKDVLSEKEPDIVVLDVTGKKINGMDTLSEIHKIFPLLPIVILSERTKIGANKAFEALQRGAIEFVTKPERSGIMLFAERHFRKRIPSAIKSAFKVYETMWKEKEKNEKSKQETELRSNLDFDVGDRVDIVAIGGCTGGPQALWTLIPGLPDDFPVPIIVVQHMPKVYTNIFAERLNDISNLEVREAYYGAKLEPGQVWIAPGGYHINIKKRGNSDIILLHKGPRENMCRPSIDSLFKSVADRYGRNVIGVLLSGRGNDGVKGSHYIKSRGGRLMVQDYTSSLIWELPEKVIKRDLNYCVLPLEEMVDELVHSVYSSRELIR